MGIFEYFALLMQGKFPQEMFLLWIKNNSPGVTEFRRPINLVDPEHVLQHIVFVTVLSTIFVCFGMGIALISLSPIHTIIEVFEKDRDFSLVLLMLFTGIGIGPPPISLAFHAWKISHFKKNLNRFQLDLAELQGLFGDDSKLMSEMALRVDQMMVCITETILRIEAGVRSQAVEAVLNLERDRMRKVEQVATKFGFTTKPWEEYFQEAGEKLKQPETSEVLDLVVKGPGESFFARHETGILGSF